ncbi:MAG TPA: adenosylcobinamide-GDP ribazoletransferase [Pseudonocardiaceae bacterium]|nr:adenosylcobinamide-GDP ribazoletransferase [Pseudonocardiaceae bacterium]
MAGLRVALSWLTVLPVPAPAVDRRTAGAAITVSPLVGALLGTAATDVVAGLVRLHCPPLLAGLLLVGLLAMATRGMHVDGLADTADGLGCYGPPERALAVMKDGGAGPFAVVTLLVVLGAQAIGIATAAGSGRWWVVALAVTTGRAAFPLCCRRGSPAARPDGLGALVAGTQPILVPVAWWLVLATIGAAAVPGRWWQGTLAVVLAGALVTVLSVHTRRRFGGITGDVLGAANELAVAAVLVVCAFGA